MKKASTLFGVVKVRGSEPAHGAVVEIHNVSGDIVDQVQVDDHGGFTYHLSAGVWALRVWDAHGRRGRTHVALVEGQSKQVHIDLEEPKGGR